MQWAAMVMRKIYMNARRPQSKRNRAEPFDWVIVVGSGIGELVRTPEMAYKAKLLHR